MGDAGAHVAHVWSVRRHEGLHVRQNQRGRSILWCVAAGGMDGARHTRTRLHCRADCSHRLTMASEPHGGGRLDPGDREPCVHRRAR